MIIPPAPVQIDPKDQSELRKALSDLTQAINTLESRMTTESGASERGSYVKFPDGTLICRFTDSALRQATELDAIDSFYYYQGAYVFPYAFISHPDVIPGVKYGGGNHVWAGNTYAITNEGVQLTFFAIHSWSGYPSYIAIGRWK